MNSGISVFADVKSRPAKRKLLLTGGRKENGRQTEGHENMEMCGDCGSLDDDYYWPANINNTVDSNPVLSSSNAPTDTAEVLPLSDEDEDKEEEMLLAQFFTNTLYNILERNDDDDATDDEGQETEPISFGNPLLLPTSPQTMLPHQQPQQYRYWTSRWPLTEFTAEVIEIANGLREVQYLPPDKDTPINPFDPLSASRATFCEAIRAVGARHNWSLSSIDDLFGVLKNHSSLDVPVTLNERTGNKQFHWKKYLRQNPGNFKIDCCIGNCCAYVAHNSRSIKCRKCPAYRYSRCDFGGRGKCPDGENCNPFINESSHKYRRAHQIMYYRSIILKLLELYKQSLTLDTKIFAYNTERQRKPGFLYDINDGTVVKEQLYDMHNAFLERADLYARENNGAKLHECSLPLSVFYDGDTLFQRASDSMWNMFVSVVNCDPSFRTKLGLGLFLAIMHNLPVGSGAEQDIIDHLYTEELKQLENGIVFEFIVGGEPHAVFLQARVVFVHVDTRALESFLHCQCAGSMAGCPFCFACSGLSRHIINVRVYAGSTCLSDPKHVMRTLGEVKPTPAGYFGDKGVPRNQELGKQISDNAQKIVLLGKPEAKTTSDDDVEKPIKKVKSVPKKKLSRDALYSHPRSVELPDGTVWENGDFPYEWFAPAIYMPHDDDRVMTLERVTHEKYLSRKAVAIAERDVYLADCVRLGKEPAKSRTFVYEGVHASTSAWFDLKAPRWEDNTNDGMHALGGMFDYYVENLTGDRGNTDNSRKLSAYQKRFMKWVKDKTIPPPYRASNESIIMLDSVMYCINVPTQFKRDYWFSYPFHGKGHMIMHQKLVFMRCYLTYLISFLDIYKPYKYYYRRVSNDYQRMFNPILEISKQDKLERDIIESAMLHESMFHCSEQPFVKHEVIEIVHSFRKYGILDGMMATFGERANKSVSDSVTTGGNKYIISTNAAYMAKEWSSFNEKYLHYKENADVFTDNTGAYSTTVLKLTGPVCELSLNDDVKEMLFTSLVDFLMSQEVDDLVCYSPFIRIYYTYLALSTSRALTMEKENEDFPPTFTLWVRSIYIAHCNSVGHFDAWKALKRLVGGIVENDDEMYHPQALQQYAQDAGTNMGTVAVDLICDQGLLFYDDIAGIITDLARFANAGEQTIAAFTSATVKGIQLRGRGQLYTENSVVLETFSGTNRVGLAVEYIIQNEGNVLAENWCNGFQNGSFFRATDYYIKFPNDRRRRMVEKITRFGQVNFFFRLFAPSDPIVNGLAFANVVLRKSQFDKERWQHRIDADDRISYDGSKRFMPLNYFDSTGVAVSVLDADKLPMLNPNQTMKYSRKKLKDYPLKFSKALWNQAKHLFMIELHPERRGNGFEYASVKEDEDRTKVFEKVVTDHHERNRIQ